MSDSKRLKLELPNTLLALCAALAELDKCRLEDVLYCLLTNGLAALVEQHKDNTGLCLCLMQAAKDVEKLASPHVPRQEATMPRTRPYWRLP